MKFGLGVNANETIPEIVKKSVEAERLGIDYVWVPDVPVQLYAPAVASAVAAGTKKVQIGVGLLSAFLHTPVQIANSISTLIGTYGERFELCIGPGDRHLLRSVGVSLHHPTGVANYLLNAKKQIEQTLKASKVNCRIWLGAQGPKMLEVSKFFDGVLLNYAQPNVIKWAIGKVGRVKKKGFQFGVFSSAYVYQDFDAKIYNLLRISSAIVALGASDTVLRKLSIYGKIAEAKKKLDTGVSIASMIDRLPPKTIKLFSIFKSSTQLEKYLSEISKIKIEHVVFSYPQNFSEKTIRELTNALKNTYNCSESTHD